MLARSLSLSSTIKKNDGKTAREIERCAVRRRRRRRVKDFEETAFSITARTIGASARARASR